jgi:hypothetical protein
MSEVELVEFHRVARRKSSDSLRADAARVRNPSINNRSNNNLLKRKEI